MKAQKNTRKSATVNQIMGFQEWGLITILSIPWGGFFFFVGVAVKEMSPLTIVLCRVPQQIRQHQVPRILQGFLTFQKENVYPLFCIKSNSYKIADTLRSSSSHEPCQIR